MKKVFVSTILLLLIFSGQAQDILYKKNGSAINCKIREITVNVIKYKRIDIAKSPVFEIMKEDVYKIRYKNGVVDIIDADFNRKKIDTADYIILYVVFNPGLLHEVFPLYVNGQHICKLKDHSRLALKIHTEGYLNIYSDNQVVAGPKCNVFAVHGQNYAVSIQVKNRQAHSPNKKFSMTVYEDPADVITFLENEFNGFNPDKEHDFQVVEK